MLVLSDTIKTLIVTLWCYAIPLAFMTCHRPHCHP